MSVQKVLTFVSVLGITLLLYTVYRSVTTRSNNDLSVETRVQKYHLLREALRMNLTTLYHEEKSVDGVKAKRFNVYIRTENVPSARKEWRINVYTRDESGWLEVSESGHACIEQETNQWATRSYDQTPYVEPCPK